MSQPKRYRPVMVSKDKVEMHQCVSGEWTSLTEFYTLHDRLAALAAEKEAETRATFDAIRTITQLRDENERLKASQLSLEKWIACEQAHFETADNLREKLYQASVQIERLRQAGDVLMQCYCAGDLVKEEWKQLPSVAQWLAAKEGRDAK